VVLPAQDNGKSAGRWHQQTPAKNQKPAGKYTGGLLGLKQQAGTLTLSDAHRIIAGIRFCSDSPPAADSFIHLLDNKKTSA
jgi:hypothetical protein